MENLSSKADISRSPDLHQINEIPERYRPIFQPLQTFNYVQSTVFSDVLNSCSHLVVGAPTGSGKTIVFELAIVELLIFIEENQLKQTDIKIIYIGPMKALCNEIFKTWERKFNYLNLKVFLLTGDTDPDHLIRLQDLMAFQIILTTPEKWDSMTRKWKDSKDFINAVKLVLIDEVHLLNDEKRGPVLEAIVSRMKTFSGDNGTLRRKTDKKIDEKLLSREIRMIAVSATFLNVEDLKDWLQTGCRNGQNAKYFRITSDKRPIKLEKHVLGLPYHPEMNFFKFDISLNYKLADIIEKHSIGKPILIFCNTRKSTEIAYDFLQSQLELNLSAKQREVLMETADRLENQKQKVGIVSGMAFHHAGLSYSDRDLIENTFRNGNILILLCTCTLAMGVNLPAHIVIIKSTEAYVQGEVQELQENSILQMIGRAGRPGFDTSGVAIIMTKFEHVRKYENLVSGTLPIESHLHQQLIEHLNSEIVLNTITTMDAARQWLKTTFFYIRARKNPHLYGFVGGIFEKKLFEICEKEVAKLKQFGLIVADDSQYLGNITISSTIFGRLMSRHYLSFETMQSFQKITGMESIAELFNTIIQCREFSDYQLRTDEKRILNDLLDVNGHQNIRFPIYGKINNVKQKISCLLQASLGNLEIENASLQAESVKMYKLAECIAGCLVEYIKASTNLKNGNFTALVSAVTIMKCFKVNLWENSPFVSKQLPKIDTNSAIRLVKNGLDSFDMISDTSPHKLEFILNQAHPFGTKIIGIVNALPKYSVRLEITTLTRFRVTVIQTNTNYRYDNKPNNGITLLIGDADNRLICFNDNVQFIISEYNSFDRVLKFYPTTAKITAYLVHQSLVGVDQIASLEVARGARTTSRLFALETDYDEIPSKVDQKLESCQNIPPKTSKVKSFKENVKNTIKNYFSIKTKTNEVKEMQPSTSTSCRHNSQIKTKKSREQKSEPVDQLCLRSKIAMYEFDSPSNATPESQRSNKIQQSNINHKLQSFETLTETPLSRKIDQVQSDKCRVGFAPAKIVFNFESPVLKPVIEIPKACGMDTVNKFFDVNQRIVEKENLNGISNNSLDKPKIRPAKKFNLNFTISDELDSDNEVTTPSMYADNYVPFGENNQRYGNSSDDTGNFLRCIMNTSVDKPSVRLKHPSEFNFEETIEKTPDLGKKQNQINYDFFKEDDRHEEVPNQIVGKRSADFLPRKTTDSMGLSNHSKNVSQTNRFQPESYENYPQLRNSETIADKRTHFSVTESRQKWIEDQTKANAVNNPSQAMNIKNNPRLLHKTKTINFYASAINPPAENENLTFRSDSHPTIKSYSLPSLNRPQKQPAVSDNGRAIENPLSNINRKMSFLSEESPMMERKKTRIDIEDLFKKASENERKNIRDFDTQSLCSFSSTSSRSRQYHNPKNSISRNIMAHVRRDIANRHNDDLERTRFLAMCKTRLNDANDADYTKKQYDLDFTRYGILRLPLVNNSGQRPSGQQLSSIQRPLIESSSGWNLSQKTPNSRHSFLFDF